MQEEEKKRREEREAAARERRYTLPDQPAVLVHPSTTAKSGKFDCTVMSLSLLLDYRQEDNKEHSFEVSLSPFTCPRTFKSGQFRPVKRYSRTHQSCPQHI